MEDEAFVGVIQSNIYMADQCRNGEEIQGMSNYLAQELFAIGGAKENYVAIILDRSPEMIISMLSVLQLGYAYVPIDPAFPKDRITYMLDDCQPSVIITEYKYQENYKDRTVILIEDIQKVYRNAVDIHFLEKYAREYSELAYIIYTSGTTGVPKGVMVTKNAIYNFMEGVSEIIDFSKGKKIICLTTVSFDIFFLESIMALEMGLDIVLVSEEEQRNPKMIAQKIMDYNIDMIQMTPSRMQLLINYDSNLECLKNVSEIMIGGEPFPMGLLYMLQEKTNAKIYNMYGPTETTIWSTISDLTKKKSIDIGRPIKNTKVYVVDEALNELPDGEVGELCISGRGLAKGYLHRAEEQKKHFVAKIHNKDQMMYRTGDLARVLPNGCLECIGRVDHQVKIRGYRIELEEIEAIANQYKNLTQAVAIVIESGNEKQLVLTYVSETELDIQELTWYMKKSLPNYMIPLHFQRMDKLIYNHNGKVDRNAIKEWYLSHVTKVEGELSDNAEYNETEKKVIQLIAKIAQIPQSSISMDMDFPSIGIDSIVFIKILVNIENEIEMEFEDDMLSIRRFQTVRDLVHYVEENC